jgi:hypothetical protein
MAMAAKAMRQRYGDLEPKVEKAHQGYYCIGCQLRMTLGGDNIYRCPGEKCMNEITRDQAESL